MFASLPLQLGSKPAEEELTQPLRFERLAGGPIAQRLRIATPLSPPRAARTFEAR